jgi:hypothetical protein
MILVLPYAGASALLHRLPDRYRLRIEPGKDAT